MKRLTWSQVIIINVIILTFAAYVVIQGALKNPTRSTSSAAPPVKSPAAVPVYPADPPQISQIEYWFGKPGDQVRLRGQNFGSARFASALFIGDLLIPADQLLSWSDKIIDFTIPDNAVSAPVSVVINNRQTAGPILSVYRQTTDPLLQFIPGPQDTTLTLTNAPIIPLTLTINDKVYQLKPNSPSTTVAVFPQKFAIKTASLADQSGQLLPLLSTAFGSLALTLPNLHASPPKSSLPIFLLS